MLATLKQKYWACLAAWRRRRHPASTSYSPHAWMDGIAHHVPDDGRPLVMVDGGAHDGQMALRFRQRFPQVEVHAFEPNADLLPRLRANLADVPGRVHGCALTAKSEPVDLIVNEFAMTSSILPRSDFSMRYFDRATTPRESRSVAGTSLDDWFVSSGLDRVDILKLDLQGFEAQALRGARRLLEHGVGCVFAEVNFVPFYEGCSLFADVDAILRESGYRLYNIYNLCTHLPEGQIGSADALWVRDAPAPGSAVLQQAA